MDSSGWRFQRTARRPTARAILLSLSGWKSTAIGEVFGVRENTAVLIGPEQHAALFSQRSENTRLRLRPKNEVFNDIIRNKAIAIRNFPCSRCSSGPVSRTWPHYMWPW
jgi:hypothetical protein